MRSWDTIGRRVGIGFFFIIVILAASVSISLSKVSQNANLSDHVFDVRVPAVRAGLNTLNGINQGVAAFRGWLLYHDPSTKETRADAWRDTLSAFGEFDSLVRKTEDPVEIQQVNELKGKIDELKQRQDAIEAQEGKINPQDLEFAKKEFPSIVREIRRLVESIVGTQDKLLRSDIDHVQANIRSLITLEWILMALGILTASLIGFYITRNITKPVASAVEASQRLAAEDFDFEVGLKGPREIEVFSQALEKMRQGLKNLTEGLRKNNALLEAQQWQIDGQIGLLERMAGDQKVGELAGNVLDYLCNRIDGLMGTFYLLEGQVLAPVGSYASYGGNVEASREFVLREGLVGQAAASGKVSVIENLPEDYFKIQSGLGGTLPKNLVVLPMIFDGKTVGVVEVASLQAFTQPQLQFLNGAGRNVAIAVNLSLSTQKTKELLEETQAQSEELQAQQEELKAANEELEAKTKSLEASEEELRSQQEQLKSTNEELEEQTLLLEREKEALAMRTTELEQTKHRLEMRAREVEQVSRYKSEFLANMSHELRTPLNSILMLSQSLNENRTGNLTERQMGAVKTIHSSGSDLLTLIEDILDLSKVEAGKLDVKPEKVAIRELCDTMREYFEPMAKEGRLAYNIEVAQGLPGTITTDPTRIKQVLKNLLSNAFKFTNQGSVTLTVFKPSNGNFRLVEEGVPCLCFSVKDSGIGIPGDQIAAVFEAFKQLDAKTTRKYGGTGLGLSIVRELVNLLGGEIKMESAEGVGTTVTVCVPETLALTTAKSGSDMAPVKTLASENRKAPAALKVVPADDDREVVKGVGDSVILIVEDDLRFANSLLELCRENGFKGVILSDGVSAVKVAEELMPQGILLDLSLPELDGSDVLRLLKANPNTRHIPIQVITGHDRKREVMNEGAIGFIRKPAQKEEVTDVLRRIRDYAGSEKRLLIVEDDPAQRRAIREYVEVPGVVPVEAATGKEGLELLKKGQVGCIILDLKLPDMDGKEFLRLSKEICGEAAPPVIIYTGKDLDDRELKELERDSKSIIVKGAKSPERLFDETMMFLHRLQKDLPAEKRKIIENLHDHTRILKGKSILVVDDDPRNIQSLTHLLEDHGVNVYEAENGKAALAWLETGRSVDLVLMDMMMPEMDGYEATRMIRKNQKLKGLPVVALTARAMKGERERCLEAGCDDYLSKPIENDKLISLLRVWLYRSA